MLIIAIRRIADVLMGGNPKKATNHATMTSETFTSHEVWRIFHQLWGDATESPRYRKREWYKMQEMITKLLLERR